MQLFLFNFHPKLHRRKWRKLRVALFQTFSTSLAACWCCCSSNLLQETVINYQVMLPLHPYRRLIEILSSLLNGAMLTGSVRRNFQNSRYFWCPVWKTKSWQKSKPTRKLNHANSILEYFEYFCQMSSKSILTISRYPVSNFARFFLRRSVQCQTRYLNCRA